MRMIDADKLLSMIGNANENVSCAVLTEYINSVADDNLISKQAVEREINAQYCVGAISKETANDMLAHLIYIVL